MNVVRYLFIASAAAVTSFSAASADYYVSAQLGDDKFDGRAAMASGTAEPFPSLRYLISVNLRHGDRILLRCGERFSGPLHLTVNNQDAGELTISSFGDCTEKNRPVIDGRVPLSVSATGQLQRIPEANSIEQVFAGDKALPRARFPAKGYLIIPEGSTPSVETLSPFRALFDRSLDGARLHARTQEWFLEERNIVDDSGRLDKVLQYPLRPKAGFYLTGKTWMIGEQRAWSFDPSEKQLAVRAAPNETLAIVPAGNLLQVTGRGSVTVAGVDFEAAGGDSINFRIDGIATVKQVNIRRGVGNGISIAGAKAAYVVSSLIEDVGLDAIFFAETKRVFVRRNKVSNAGLYGGPRPSLAAINAHRTSSATIEENIVEDSAYHGIRFAGDARIRRNYVARSCLLLSDCAAIYTWRRNAVDVRPHSEVIGNLVMGASGDTTVKLGVNDWFAGIYLDEFSSNILVAGNLIVAVNQGVYLHNAFGNVVRNNVVRAIKKSIIDAADLTKFPNGKYVSNDVKQNSERLGDFAALIVDSTGKPKGFEFGDTFRVELRLSDRATQGRTGVTCSADPAYATDSFEIKDTMLFNVFNCE